MSFSSAPGAALGARGGRGQAGGGSGEARFRPPRSAEPLGRAEKPQFVKLAGRGGSGGRVFRPNRTQTEGPDVPAKGDPTWLLGRLFMLAVESLFLRDKMVQAR